MTEVFQSGSWLCGIYPSAALQPCETAESEPEALQDKRASSRVAFWKMSPTLG